MGNGLNAKTRAILTERFGRDTLLALATLDGDRPAVRTVDSYYLNGSFYTVTSALSGKMQQIAANPAVAVCGEWFTAHGVGQNLGHVRDEKNAPLMATLREAFAAWYGNGHVDESDPHTCLLRIRLQDGVLMAHGERFALDFTAEGT